MYRNCACSFLSYTFTFVSKEGKGKARPVSGLQDPGGEYRHSSTRFLISALDGGGWSAPFPDLFTSGKETRCPVCRKLGGPQGRSGRAEISPQPGFDPLAVQPILSRYTSYTIPAHIFLTATIYIMSSIAIVLYFMLLC
jgi:hypothetical protein